MALRSVANVRPAFVQAELLDRLAAVVVDAKRPLREKGLLVVTGAGISTESGIPDYRSPGRPEYRPLQHNEFVKQADVRRRYWARSFTAYDRMLNARPSRTHTALAALERSGYIAGGHSALARVSLLAHFLLLRWSLLTLAVAPHAPRLQLHRTSTGCCNVLGVAMCSSCTARSIASDV